MQSLKTHIPLYYKVSKIATELGVQPIIYGWLAVWYFTGQDRDCSIHDIDILFPASLLDRFSDIWHDRFPDISLEKTQRWDIIITDDSARIDIDSREKSLWGRDSSIIEYTFDNNRFYILNQESLKDIYREAYERMPENEYFRMARSKYQEKYSKL